MSYEKEKNSLNDTQSESLEKLLINAKYHFWKIKQVVDIVYNKEEGLIENIKILKYSDEKKEYKLQFNENKKKTSSTKSKSNIDEQKTKKN